MEGGNEAAADIFASSRTSLLQVIAQKLIFPSKYYCYTRTCNRFNIYIQLGPQQIKYITFLRDSSTPSPLFLYIFHNKGEKELMVAVDILNCKREPWFLLASYSENLTQANLTLP